MNSILPSHAARTNSCCFVPKESIKRDDKIQAGKISPVAVNEPVIDLKLPDGFGRTFGTRDYLAKKNLVLITGRAWW